MALDTCNWQANLRSKGQMSSHAELKCKIVLGLRTRQGSTQGLCGHTRTRPIPAGSGRVGYDLQGYGATSTGTSGYIPALLAKISLFLPHAVYSLN